MKSTKSANDQIHLAASLLGSLGGKAKTPAKQNASRDNGGMSKGRPRKPWRELSKAGRYARKRREKLRKEGK